MPIQPIIYLTFANDQSGNTAHFLRALQEECNLLQDVLMPLDDSGKIRVEAEPNITPLELMKAFQQRFRNRILIYHYGGHAGANELFMEDDTTGNQTFYSQGLADVFAQQKSLKLVFLNGCATRPQVDLLLKAGIPAVVATTTKIDDNNALDFATTFYRGLANGATIQEAFNEAEAFLKGIHRDVSLFRDLYWDEEVLATQKELPWRLFCRTPEDANWSLVEKQYTPVDIKTFLVGKTVGNYLITDYLSVGNYGYVFKGKHSTLGNEAAIKVSHQILSGYEKVRDITITGNKGLRQLNHENIAKIYDVNEYELNEKDKRFYIAMELVNGKRLDQIDLGITKANREQLKKTFAQILQIMEGLKFAHEVNYEDSWGMQRVGIFHGNIKTRKILFDTQFVPKLIDFMFTDLTRQNDVKMAIPQDVLNVYNEERPQDYFSPEQIQSNLINAQTDIYSVGAVLFELFTGQKLGDISVQSPSDVWRWMQKRNPNLPKQLSNIIYKALQPQAAQRYTKMADMISDILSLQSLWMRILYFLGFKKIQ